MQHRANRNVRGRHRRTTALHSHRAPSTPVTERGRYAVAAALVAGIGVTGMSTAADGTSSSPAVAQTRQAAAHAPLSPLSALPAAQTPLPGASTTPAPLPGASTTPAPLPGASTTPAPLPGALAAQAQLPAAAAAFSAQAPLSAVPYAQAGLGSAGAGAVDQGLSFLPQARKVKPVLQQWVDPLPEGTTTSCFGQRWGRLHAGVDLAAPDGTPIRAAGAGVVVAAGPAEGYGNAVLIDHGNGYLTHYGHLSAITVTVGQHLAAGDQLGNEGSTGHSTGPHLHFEVHQGFYKNPIEPTAWMHEHGVDIAGCTTF